MRARQQDGRPLREHLQRLAERGHATAIAGLEGPEPPAALLHLYEWILELDGTRGWDMNGNRLPLSYTELAAWARLTGRHPRPHEVEALVLLDRVLRNPPPREEPV